MVDRDQLFRLHIPFHASDVEWRLSHSGESNGKLWAMALCYVTNRAIMERLDAAVGPENWRNEYKPSPCGGVLCGLSINVGGEWITKWDGSGNMDASSAPGGLSQSDAAKGTLSGAMKRAAVQWGIGRYLYNLPEGWATCYEDTKRGQFRGKTKNKKAFSWDPPELPKWALPDGTERARTVAMPEDAPEPDEYPEVRGLVIRAEGLGIGEHIKVIALQKVMEDDNLDQVKKGIPVVRALIEATESATNELDLEKAS